MPDNLSAYTGRWVALVRGQVAGVGLTAEAALSAAQLARPKEKPQVLFVSENPKVILPDIVDAVRRALPASLSVWVVGGAVRDALLNRRVRDVDFVVEGDALNAGRAVAHALRADFYPLDAERGVGRVLVAQADDDDAPLTLDFARARGDDLTADLAARDFTVNAMAVALAAPEVLIDPLRGEADLRAKIIRACSPAAVADDPVRGLRAIRLAAQLDFRLEAETRAAVRMHAADLTRVSAERVRDEFIRCLNGPRPAAALRAAEMLGLLHAIAPELTPLKGMTQPAPHTLDVWEHSLAVIARLDEALTLLGPVHDVDAASDLILGLISVQLGRYRMNITEHLRTPLAGDRPARAVLMLAALWHDAGKAATRTVEAEGPVEVPRGGRIRFLGHEAVSADLIETRMDALHFSADEIKRARLIAANHMRPRQLSKAGAPSRRAIYRFFRDTGPAGVDIVLLSLADYLGKFGGSPPPQDEWAAHLAVCAQLLEAYFTKPEEMIAPPVLITGFEVMKELGLPPGPRVGEILEAVREAQAAGEIANATAALELARRCARVD